MNINNVLVYFSKDELSDEEKCKLEEYLESYADWSELLGALAFQKLLTRAYMHICLNNWEKIIPTYSIRVMQDYYNVCIHRRMKNEMAISSVLRAFSDKGIEYCMLKGAVLQKDVFPNTIREFNDTDFLISKKHLDLVSNVLHDYGYIQGTYSYKKQTIFKSRFKEISYLLDTHQVLPYCLATKDLIAPVSRVDIQFEFTLQKKMNYNIDYNSVIARRIEIEYNGIKIYTLDNFDNFLMLCTHLHGEAVIFSEICKGKDLQLSKIADIFQWLQKYANNYCWDVKVKTIMGYNMQIPVAYSMYLVYNVYRIEIAKSILDKLGIEDYSFIDYYYNENNEWTRWDKPVLERMFCTKRPQKQRS